MKIVRFDLWKIFSCLTYLLDFIKRLLRRKKTRRNSNEFETPTSISIEGAQEKANSFEETQDQYDESTWTTWGAEESNISANTTEGAGQQTIHPPGINPNHHLSTEDNPQQEFDDVNLFENMEPVFKKPKKILIKKPVPFDTPPVNSFSSRLNFDMTVPIEADLTTWTENSSAWEAEAPCDDEIEWQTQHVIKERRQAEREQRLLEQKRKREEKEALRLTKKNLGLGVKLS